MRPTTALGCVLIALAVGAPIAGADEFDPDVVFTTRCGACHTVGDGDDIGPDLAGVTERRERSWLIPFIQSSQTVIASGDETAVTLFEEYGRQKMPDHPYTADQIEMLLAYIESGGPEDPNPPVRVASTASEEEVETGRALFHGERELTNGGVACATCHSTGAESRLLRSLGGELSTAFARYRDVRLSASLARMETPVMSQVYGDRPLTEEEAFCIKAYLANLGASEQDEDPIFPWAGILAGLVLGVVGDGAWIRWRRRNGV